MMDIERMLCFAKKGEREINQSSISYTWVYPIQSMFKLAHLKFKFQIEIIWKF